MLIASYAQVNFFLIAGLFFLACSPLNRTLITLEQGNIVSVNSLSESDFWSAKVSGGDSRSNGLNFRLVKFEIAVNNGEKIKP